MKVLVLPRFSLALLSLCSPFPEGVELVNSKLGLLGHVLPYTTFLILSAYKKRDLSQHCHHFTGACAFSLPQDKGWGILPSRKGISLFRKFFVSICSLESFLACPFYRGQQFLFLQGIIPSCLDTSLTFRYFCVAQADFKWRQQTQQHKIN